ncbi:MAG: BrnA antitoxin family protein [Verrucomicrobiales bacterium]|jgi:predicted DNA binding CopG/RHH family protein|nr:BrnA antitoxin family protein [Verrucomicrobiales bacterium]
MKKKINKFEEFVPEDYDEKNMVTLTREQELAMGIPAPGEIARMRKLNRVTINLENNSVEFFKRQARKVGVPYQTLIREALHHYVAQAA